MRVVRFLALLLTFALSAQIACSDAAAPPVPGELTVVLDTPNTDDRAILLRVTGPQMTAIVSANAAYELHTRTGSSDFKSAAFGSLTDGPLVRFAVPDVNRVGTYTATIIEIGDSANALRGSLAGYGVTIVKP